MECETEWSCWIFLTLWSREIYIHIKTEKITDLKAQKRGKKKKKKLTLQKKLTFSNWFKAYPLGMERPLQACKVIYVHYLWKWPNKKTLDERVGGFSMSLQALWLAITSTICIFYQKGNSCNSSFNCLWRPYIRSIFKVLYSFYFRVDVITYYIFNIKSATYIIFSFVFVFDIRNVWNIVLYITKNFTNGNR